MFESQGAGLHSNDRELEGTKVLVTGAGGFIGSHLVERLTELGAQVRAMVRYNSTGTAGGSISLRSGSDIDVVFSNVRIEMACGRRCGASMRRSTWRR